MKHIAHRGYNTNNNSYDIDNNNSHFDSFFFLLTDDVFREVVETVPLESSFTMISDYFWSGALIEGAIELIGHNTNNYVSNKTRAPSTAYLQYLQLNKP
ncbi:putative metacaspase [Trifolium repens]|jgi:hypothetical protein|nr:putative metacaspase [Trifolium repens]